MTAPHPAAPLRLPQPRAATAATIQTRLRRPASSIARAAPPPATLCRERACALPPVRWGQLRFAPERARARGDRYE